MSTPSAFLEDQHRRIDQGIEDVAAGGGELAALVESLALLRLHLYAEEAVLFPPLEKTGLTMPVFVMQREHGMMWPLILELEAACAANGPSDAMRETAGELLRLLQIHNPKEEQILYTAADRMALDEGSGAMVAALAQAQSPAGWACKMAGKH